MLLASLVLDLQDLARNKLQAAGAAREAAAEML